ncbi:hypothetical protein QEN19_003363 [Hanseniaspora menglaensis]
MNTFITLKGNSAAFSQMKNAIKFTPKRCFSKTSSIRMTNQEKLLHFYKTNYYKYQNRKYYKYYAIGTIISAGFVAYYTSETMNTTMTYGYRSIKRILNVTSTLMKCIFNYSIAISKKSSLSIEDYTNLLNETHQKSAEQTLATIQEIGGIYVKLRPTHIRNDLPTTTSMDRHNDSFATTML